MRGFYPVEAHGFELRTPPIINRSALNRLSYAFQLIFQSSTCFSSSLSVTLSDRLQTYFQMFQYPSTPRECRFWLLYFCLRYAFAIYH